jgi:hypothetical protein
MAAAYSDMRTRLQTANANRSALLSTEDLARTSVDLRFAAQMAARQKLPPVCEVVVDGGPFVLPIDMIAKDDVAMLELYLEKGSRSGPTSINGRGTQGGTIRTTAGPDRGACGPFRIFVWMR